MENVIEQQQGIDIVGTLIQKAWESTEFKEKLINNPSRTISEITGKELTGNMPSGKKLVVVDQTDESKFYLNIPVKPKLDIELSEEQLEQVAGGATGPCYDAGKATGDWIQEKCRDFADWVHSL